MDLSPSPFWIKKQKQTLVFDFSDINQRWNDDDDDEPEVLIGKNNK